MEEFNLMSGNDPDAFTDAGVLYSHVFGEGWFRVTAAGGLGFLQGRKTLRDNKIFPYNYTTEKIFTPAIPLELGIDLSGRRVGFGIAGFANFNFNTSITGIIFRVIFGKIR